MSLFDLSDFAPPTPDWAAACYGAQLESEFGPYSADPLRYVARCVPCHKAFDLAAIRQ